MSDRLVGLGSVQIDGLIARMRDFDDRHQADSPAGHRPRGPLRILPPRHSRAGRDRSPTDLIYPVFQSHPRPELLADSRPREAFGCSSCHNGNGRATRNVTKGHGRHKFWLWPLFYPENVEAGCHQCHAREVVTVGGETLNQGRELYMNKGCWGCHRFDGFDAESEELTARPGSRLAESGRGPEMPMPRRCASVLELGDTAADRVRVPACHYARAEELRLTNTRDRRGNPQSGRSRRRTWQGR